MYSNYQEYSVNAQTQPSGFDMTSFKEQEARNVGKLTPVFLNDVIQTRNIDYLQHLCSLCERLRVNPIWFDLESAENKQKMLKIYQMAIQYTNNTDEIYQECYQEMLRKVDAQRKVVKRLYDEVAENKKEIDNIKNNYRKRKLQKEKYRIKRI